MSRLQTNAMRHLGSAVDNLTLDNAGRVLMPNQPAVGVRMSGLQNIAHNTNTKVQFNTIDFEKGSNFNTSLNRFTAPVDGVYSIHAHLYIYTVNSAEVYIFKNGSVYIRSSGVSVTATNPNGAQVNHLINLVAGDYIEIFAGQYNGNTQSIYTGSARESYLSIALLS